MHIKNAESNAYTDMQIMNSWNASSRWVRHKVDGTWQNWQEVAMNVPSFYKNYANLASLSAGLNTFFFESKGSNHDPDTYLTTSCGYCEIDAAKSPTGAYRGWLYVILKISSEATFQFFTADNTTNLDIYYRKYYRGTFSSWKKFTLADA